MTFYFVLFGFAAGERSAARDSEPDERVLAALMAGVRQGFCKGFAQSRILKDTAPRFVTSPSARLLTLISHVDITLSVSKPISFQIEIDPRSPHKRMMCNRFAIRREMIKGFVRLEFAMVEEGEIISDEFVAYGLWSDLQGNKEGFLQFADTIPADDGQSEDS